MGITEMVLLALPLFAALVVVTDNDSIQRKK
jgi:hypothetical protein